MLTEAERSSYAEQGVLHLRGVIDAVTVSEVLAAIDHLVAERGGEPSRGGMDRLVYRSDERFRRLAFDSSLAAIAGDATGSDAVRLYFDQIFTREPEAPTAFDWHQDRPYWPVSGDQVCSTWVALTASTVAGSALEFVAGSHRWGVTYRPVFSRPNETADELDAIWPGLAAHVASFPERAPAFEEHPERFDVVGFDVEAGDVVVFGPRIVHRSRANITSTRRAAISLRWLGDDARWTPMPGADPVIGPDDTWLASGDLIRDDATFPVVWRR
jgi:ectoine hydroxylase-related dioxygenase (phytanoyl-CoA dioxygenase family)